MSQPSSPRSSHGLPSPPDSPDQYPSDAESIASNSSFPSVSVSSSFFFSSAAHSPHTQSEGGNASEGASQGLIIPSLALPEALHRPTPWGKTLGDLRVLIVDLVGEEGEHQHQSSESQFLSQTASSSPHEDNMTTLIKDLLRENEDVVEVDVDWEWDEVGHVPVRVLYASTDWIEHSDPHGLEKYDPTKNIQFLDVGKNDVEDIKRIVLEPFHELSSVLPYSSSPSTSIGLLANLISAPTTPLYTALLLLVPSSGAQLSQCQTQKYTQVISSLGTLVPILPVAIPPSSLSHLQNVPHGPTYKFSMNPGYSPSYHHHRHPDHPLASTHPHHPMSKLNSGESLLHAPLISHSRPVQVRPKLKPFALPILRNMLFRPDTSHSSHAHSLSHSHTLTQLASNVHLSSSTTSNSASPSMNPTGVNTPNTTGGIMALRSEAAELFLRWWRVDRIVQGIVTGKGSTNSLHEQESTVVGYSSRHGHVQIDREGEGATFSKRDQRRTGSVGVGVGGWSIFKAKWEDEWEKKWEEMEEDLSRDVAVRLREVRDQEKEINSVPEEGRDEEAEESMEEEDGGVEEETNEERQRDTEPQHEREVDVEKSEKEEGSEKVQTEDVDEHERSSETSKSENMDESVIFQLDLSPRSPHAPTAFSSSHSSPLHSAYTDAEKDEHPPTSVSSLANSFSSLSSFEVRYHHNRSLDLGLDPHHGIRDRRLEDQEGGVQPGAGVEAEGEDEKDDEDGPSTSASGLSKTLTTRDYQSPNLLLPRPPPPTSKASPQPASSSSDSSAVNSPMMHSQTCVVTARAINEHDQEQDHGPSHEHKDMTPTSSILSTQPLSPKTPKTIKMPSQGRLARRESASTGATTSGIGSGTIRRKISVRSSRSRSRSTSPNPAFTRTGLRKPRGSLSAIKPKTGKRASSPSRSLGPGKGKEKMKATEAEDDGEHEKKLNPEAELGMEMGPGLGFDPLHLPSLLAFSLSLLRPLKDRVKGLVIGISAEGSGTQVDATVLVPATSASTSASTSTSATEGQAPSSSPSSPDATTDVAGTGATGAEASAAIASNSKGKSKAETKVKDNNRSRGLSIFVVSLGVGVGLGYVIGRSMNRVVVGVE
ncbi:hypothetical protein K435DRAFT_853349 [Dendrothele bispora CBS 962.96]|uniref:Uncharacterized protein n=1 Tax=Dendrothele bispora (strain CBS 962.96) TaxID=1314807 RepID=A0A4S8MH88_DENBC|nr:hypothetical protein K435DRAFT_853349 [Dendrothele bispora CBS 962.96]